MDILNAIFLIYFITHIPATVFVDSQSVFPASIYPAWAKEAVKWHIQQNDDHLVAKNLTWFVSLVMCECAVQLPFFFVAIYAILKRKNWFRLPAIVYGVHVTTTMVPILGEILFGVDAGPKRWQLFAIYVPYLIVPLLLTIKMLVSPKPFGEPPKKKLN